MENPSILTPEVLTPRLGDYLVERKLITREDLQRALDYQKALQNAGQPLKLLGAILVEMNLIDRTALDHAITEQILQLKTALQQANSFLEQRVRERTAELEDALKRLSELSQLKANFVANISHELRTPLTHLKGYLELLLAGDLGPLQPEQEQALKIMQRSSERLEKLIEDLLLFSITERGEVTLHKQPVNLANLSLVLINRSVNKANENQITLRLECPRDLPWVYADKEKISWVILQLLDNAIKFNTAGGEVVLKAEAAEGMVSIKVKDTGIGIPSDRIEEIFEPFHQLDGSSTRRYPGTGLGLGLVRKIVEAHGSIIKVTSETGKGSQFEFFLSTTEDLPPPAEKEQ